MRRVSLCALLALTVTVDLSAHDFWLAVTRSPNSDVATVAGHVGETFPVPDSPTTPDRVDIWRMIGPTGEVPHDGAFHQEGESLATRVALGMPGAYLGIMTIRARDIEMTGPEFTDYLREEGLERVIAERARLDQTNASALERYARYAKIVLRSGDGDAAHITGPAGLKAEFVPSADPTTLAAGDTLRVRLLVEGRPVPDALITAVSAEDARLDARTTVDGWATFTLPAGGAWLIKTVHMARPADPGEPAADWESYWVTLAFDI